MAGTVHTIYKNEHTFISYCTECTLMPFSVIDWGRGICGKMGGISFTIFFEKKKTISIDYNHIIRKPSFAEVAQDREV